MVSRLLLPHMFANEQRPRLPPVPAVARRRERSVATPLPQLRAQRKPKPLPTVPVRQLWRSGVKEWCEHRNVKVDMRTRNRRAREADELKLNSYVVSAKS